MICYVFCFGLAKLYSAFPKCLPSLFFYTNNYRLTEIYGVLNSLL